MLTHRAWWVKKNRSTIRVVEQTLSGVDLNTTPDEVVGRLFDLAERQIETSARLDRALETMSRRAEWPFGGVRVVSDSYPRTLEAHKNSEYDEVVVLREDPSQRLYFWHCEDWPSGKGLLEAILPDEGDVESVATAADRMVIE